MKSYSIPIKDKSEVMKSFGNDFNEIVDFINFISPALKNQEELKFYSIDDIDLFSKYQSTLNWRNKISNQNEPIINLLLEKIVDKEVCENYFRKVLRYSRDLHYERVTISEKYRTTEYIRKLKKSGLSEYQKLFLLNLVTVKEHFQEYIQPTIEVYRQTKDNSLKNMLYDILKRVLN